MVVHRLRAEVHDHQPQSHGTAGERQVCSGRQRCDEEQDQLPHSAADPFESAPLTEMVGI